jgi:hypothetical protein
MVFGGFGGFAVCLCLLVVLVVFGRPWWCLVGPPPSPSLPSDADGF